MGDPFPAFDLNVRIEQDDDGNLPFNLNEPILEDHSNGIDLNLPLDEFGAVDFDYVQNLSEHAAPIEANHQRKDMTEDVRKQIYQSLLARSKNGKLGKKDTTIVADQFGVHIRTVQRLWKQCKIQLANNISVVVASRKKGRSGRKAVPLDLERLRNIPLKQRMTIEDVSKLFNTRRMQKTIKDLVPAVQQTVSCARYRNKKTPAGRHGHTGSSSTGNTGKYY
ncbi:uncharacterized protein [Miscanthus floridulus]|uniref:uncharacterized protein n=1 Tax=Miscanthus floridulus TaxID=154761 RepID=UPI00345913DE